MFIYHFTAYENKFHFIKFSKICETDIIIISDFQAFVRFLANFIGENFCLIMSNYKI